MNGIIKAVCRTTSLKRLNGSLFSALNSGVKVMEKRGFGSLWYMCSFKNGKSMERRKNQFICSCGCLSRNVHTKGEKELMDFLSEEIAAERKTHQLKTIPSELDGFQVQLDGSEVTLTKKNADELITISFNVNHTVDSEAETEINPSSDKADFANLKSKPSFDVDIKRGPQTLSFSCSFLSEAGAGGEEGYSDIFGIDEVTMYQGDWNDKTYAVAGEVLDGYLYDLLMTLLEEKGISNEFVDKLSSMSTAYESSSYIALLENLQKFASGK